MDSTLDVNKSLTLTRKQKRNLKNNEKRKQRRQDPTKRKSNIDSEIRHQDAKKRRFGEEIQQEVKKLETHLPEEIKKDIEINISHLRAQQVFAQEHKSYLKGQKDNKILSFYRRMPLDLMPDFRNPKIVKPLDEKEFQTLQTTFLKEKESLVREEGYLRIRNLCTLKTFISGCEITDYYVDCATMMCYLNMVSIQVKPGRILVYDSQIVSKILEENYRRVQAFKEREGFKLFDHDLILFPICHQAHWSLAALDLENRQIRHFDPLTGIPDVKLTNKIKLYLDYQVIARGYENNPMTPLFHSQERISEFQLQKNNYDCGVFVMMYARSLMMNKPFEYTQEHMPLLRQRISLELIQDKIDEIF